jgi:hypothetical protein
MSEKLLGVFLVMVLILLFENREVNLKINSERGSSESLLHIVDNNDYTKYY